MNLANFAVPRSFVVQCSLNLGNFPVCAPLGGLEIKFFARRLRAPQLPQPPPVHPVRALATKKLSKLAAPTLQKWCLSSCFFSLVLIDFNSTNQGTIFAPRLWPNFSVQSRVLGVPGRAFLVASFVQKWCLSSCFFCRALRAKMVPRFVLFCRALRAKMVPWFVLFRRALRAKMVPWFVLFCCPLRAKMLPWFVLFCRALRAKMVPWFVLFCRALRAKMVPWFVLFCRALRAHC